MAKRSRGGRPKRSSLLPSLSDEGPARSEAARLPGMLTSWSRRNGRLLLERLLGWYRGRLARAILGLQDGEHFGEADLCDVRLLGRLVTLLLGKIGPLEKLVELLYPRPEQLGLSLGRLGGVLLLWRARRAGGLLGPDLVLLLEAVGLSERWRGRS